MTIKDYILPMSAKRRIFFITYPGAALLDFAGPSGVFSVANEQVGGQAVYDIQCLSATGGLVKQNTGLAIETCPLADIRFKPSDTVLVIGAPDKALVAAMRDSAISQSLNIAQRICHRYGSICTGAFVLGASGLLDGRKSCTHWASQKALRTNYPATLVDDDALYTRDGHLWTSAGVTTGIDMALAMVEADHGRLLKSRVARHLLVYAHRPGHQSQFTDILMAQTRADTQFSELIDWLSENLHQSLKVEDMAAFMKMSQRSFHRHFVSVFDQSPGKFFEQLRLDRAQKLIEAGEPVALVAGKVGFQSIAAFRTAFKAYVGVTPGHYAAMTP